MRQQSLKDIYVSSPVYWNTNNKPPFTANSRALFARAPNLGNKENRDCGLGLKNMAKLMAGFIQNCKIILSMLKYEIMFTNL